MKITSRTESEDRLENVISGILDRLMISFQAELDILYDYSMENMTRIYQLERENKELRGDIKVLAKSLYTYLGVE